MGETETHPQAETERRGMTMTPLRLTERQPVPCLEEHPPALRIRPLERSPHLAMGRVFHLDAPYHICIEKHR